MKIKDTAMGAWFRRLNDQQAVFYIAECLCNADVRDSVFWQVIERYELRAKNPIDMAKQVFERLMEFDPDEADKSDADECEDEQRGRDREIVNALNRGDL